MIEKELEKFYEELKEGISEDDGGYTTQVQMAGEVGLEMVRLARLGLWAEEHGIPRLTYARDVIDHEFGECKGHRQRVDFALSKIPKR